MVNAVNNIAEMYLSNVVFKSITAGGEVITAEGENEYFVVTQVTDVPKDGVLYVKPMYTKSGTSAEAFVNKIYTINYK